MFENEGEPVVNAGESEFKTWIKKQLIYHLALF